jgi:hypothetical protein
MRCVVWWPGCATAETGKFGIETKGVNLEDIGDAGNPEDEPDAGTDPVTNRRHADSLA